MAVKARRRLTQAQRLDLLEREHEAALDKIASAMFGQANRAEVRFRTAENARARRQAAGVTRSGRRSGATGRKSRTRISVKEEQRREAERVVDAQIAKNPDSPVARAWRRREQEIAELRKARQGSHFLDDPGSDAGGRVQVKAYCVKPHTRRVRVRVG
jgi:hypothetical protein